MPRGRNCIALVAAILLLGSVPRQLPQRVGSIALGIPRGPYLPESRLRVTPPGLIVPYRLDVFGPGSVDGSTYVVPAIREPASATLIAAAFGIAGIADIELAPAPAPHRALIAVASYDDGIVLHDARTFSIAGYLPTGGPPGDVTFGRGGTIAAPDTDGTELAVISRSPWHVTSVSGVPTGNEIVADRSTGTFFVSNRDVNGFGSVTRVLADGSVARVRAGVTSEGLAFDSSRNVVYVGNVNDASVTEIDASSLRVLHRIASVPRTFGIALNHAGSRLFVVSNTSRSMPAGGGYAAAIDLRSSRPHIAVRSARFSFPLGAAYDAAGDRLFVTDEADNAIEVLDGRTLRRRRPRLRTCDTPWRPYVDALNRRLFVPCARSNAIDVFDLRTLRRVPHAPFATGGFPLGVAAWP